MRYIEKVSMQMDANTSAKTVSPEIEDVNFTSPSRAFNQKEVDVFYEIGNNKVLPSQLVDINRLITTKTMKQLNEDFTSQRQTIINKANKLNQNGIALYSPIIDKQITYSSTNLHTLLNLQLVSNLNVISIPDFNSNIGEFKQILKESEKHIDSYPDKDVYGLPHLVSISKDFKDKLAHLTDIGHRAFVLVLWGYSKSLGNLNYLQDYVRNSNYDLWIHSCNLDRAFQPTKVAIPHALTFFGVDTYSKKMFDVRSLWDSEKEEMREIKTDTESIRYFYDKSLGIIPKNDLPQSFINKLRKLGAFNGDGELQIKKSKLYEMIEGQSEFEICTERIKKSEFREYASEKECLRNTIQNLRLLES